MAMKKKIMMFIVLIPLLASAQVNITTNENATQEIMPNSLSGNITFGEKSQNSNTIKEHFNAIVADVKRFDPKGEFCRDGGYYITPRYNYKDQKQALLGYSGTLSLSCGFSSIDQYNTLMLEIDKNRDKNVALTQGALSWGLSTKLRNETYLVLRSTLLQTAKKQAEFFSKELKMNCEISSVNFEGRPFSQEGLVSTRMRLSESMGSTKNESIPTEEPIKQKEELSIDAVVNYTCANKQ
jgi:hypothetical protein